VKLILEIGTLQTPISSVYQMIKSLPNAECLEVQPFAAPVARNFFRYVHDREPPTDLMEQTRGTALILKHFYEGLSGYVDYERIAGMMKALDAKSVYLLRILYILGGETSAARLMTCINDVAAAETLNWLIVSKEIVKADSHIDLVRFAHPVFYQYFKQFAGDHIERTACRRIVENELATPPATAEHARFLMRLADKAGDVNLTVDLAWQCARLALREQKHDLCASACRLVLERKSDDVHFTVHLLMLQALVICGQFTAAFEHEETHSDALSDLSEEWDQCRQLIGTFYLVFRLSL
jgi:hypothetical protein